MTIDISVQLSTEICCTCGTLFGILTEVQARRKQDHQSFFCPFGHSQSYNGKSEADKLREQLEISRRERAEALERAWKAEGAERKAATALKRTEKRVGNGVCPCCNRTFENLARHMASQHPVVKKKETK